MLRYCENCACKCKLIDTLHFIPYPTVSTLMLGCPNVLVKLNCKVKLRNLLITTYHHCSLLIRLMLSSPKLRLKLNCVVRLIAIVTVSLHACETLYLTAPNLLQAIQTVAANLLYV